MDKYVSIMNNMTGMTNSFFIFIKIYDIIIIEK